MHLPDVQRPLSLADRTVRDLGLALGKAGLDAGLLRKLARVGERLDDALRAPMRVWHARRMAEPGAVAVRLFLLHDAVSTDEAAAALGDLSPWRDAGLVEDRDGGALASRFHLALAGDLFCFGDEIGLGGTSVMPLAGLTLDLARAAAPGKERVGRVLDLGCGAGAVGLLLARSAARVVATDINPRAIAFAKFNAILNGVSNVETRLGDAFAPCAGERFDRVVVQPPFVAHRPGYEPSVYVHGGERGDELALRIASEIPVHLAEGGRAVVAADWPLVDGETVEKRVRGALGAAPANVLVLQSPSKNLDEYCVQLTAGEHPDLGPEFARAAIAHRSHLDLLGVTGMAVGFVVIEPRRSAGWTSRIDIRHLHDAPVTPEAVDRILAAQTLVHGEDALLCAAPLRLPDGARQVVQPLPEGPPSVIFHPPPGRPEWPVVLTGAEAQLVQRIALAPHALDPADRAAVDVARKALAKGVLDVDATFARASG